MWFGRGVTAYMGHRDTASVRVFLDGGVTGPASRAGGNNMVEVMGGMVFYHPCLCDSFSNPLLYYLFVQCLPIAQMARPAYYFPSPGRRRYAPAQRRGGIRV